MPIVSIYEPDLKPYQNRNTGIEASLIHAESEPEKRTLPKPL